MTKVLIADDDALVRMFLKQMIPWEADGYQIVGDARDGEEALSLFEQFAPDLVIADVSMPVMNGIDLLKRLKERGFDGGVIMLSCHDDFEYVKTAMQLGADEYLLKNHLSPDTLRTALAAVAESTQKRQNKAGKQGEMDAILEKGLRQARREVLQKLLAMDRCPFEEQLAMIEAARFSGSYRQCVAVQARLAQAEAEKAPRFFELCQQVAVGNHADAVPVRKTACVFLMDMTGYPSRSRQQELADTLCHVIDSYAWQYLQLRVSCGVSSLCDGDGSIARAVRQADRALLAAFYREGVWRYEDTRAMTDGCPPEAERLARALPRLLEAGGEPALNEAVERAAEAVKKARVMPGAAVDWLRRCDAAAGLARQQAAYAQIDSFAALRRALDEYAGLLRQGGGAALPGEVSPAVAEAARYLQQHFAQPVTLSEVAARVSLSPNYLSARFKQEMGAGFVEYLTELRLAQVRELMRKNRWDTVKSIARQAGFIDYQHFCKVFKRKTGQSPNAYRKQFAGEDAVE
ncbi:response regulator [Butyricicoccus faecihominis]|uniref:response regulator n=1 Tax=Butyricicoccus faecihominis TaxID=1712515 RepID=UPI002479B601|nr:response regulator [Butyricicoccus faecihominis]MCQ5130510.1 response regulator [Butyricicoccus faecihominis]